MDIVHLDGDPNNCRIDNLKWVERSKHVSEHRDNRPSQTRRNDR